MLLILSAQIIRSVGNKISAERDLRDEGWKSNKSLSYTRRNDFDHRDDRTLMIAIILVETIIWVPFENSASDLDIHTHIIHYINVPKKDVGIKQIYARAHVIFQTWFIFQNFCFQGILN